MSYSELRRELRKSIFYNDKDHFRTKACDLYEEILESMMKPGISAETVRLHRDFLNKIYSLCQNHDFIANTVPTIEALNQKLIEITRAFDDR